MFILLVFFLFLYSVLRVFIYPILTSLRRSFFITFSIDLYFVVWYIYIVEMQNFAPLAQLVEHLTLNQGVHGSSP